MFQRNEYSYVRVARRARKYLKEVRAYIDGANRPRISYVLEGADLAAVRAWNDGDREVEKMIMEAASQSDPLTAARKVAALSGSTAKRFW
jgi:hypothetical protein